VADEVLASPRRYRWLEQLRLMVGDVSLAPRQFSAHPVFAVTFVLTMAIGIGANAAVFSAVNAVLFKAPPVPDIDRVIHAKAQSECDNGMCGAHPDWISRVKPGLQTIAPIGGYTLRRSSVSMANRSAIVYVQGVWGGYFSVLGLRPFIGRLLGPSDDISGDAAVVSYRLWRDWLSSRPDPIGQQVTVADRVFTVVGVLPPEFRGLDRSVVLPTDVWVPFGSGPPPQSSYLIGRLRPDSTFEVAANEVRTATAGLDASRDGYHLELTHLLEALRDFPQGYYAIAALALAPCALIACLAGANLTVLLFARLSGRMTEIATRVMLGATRLDLTRLLAIEISILVVLGAAAGVWMAAFSSRFFQIPEFGGMSMSLDLSLDWRVFVYALGIASLAAAVVISRVTAQVLDVDALSLFATTSGAGTVTFRSAGSRVRLIAFQAAAAVSVLVLAGLFLRSALLGSAVDPALDSNRAAAAWFDHEKQGYGEPRAREVSRQVLHSAQQILGVHSAALMSQLPGYAGVDLTLFAEEPGVSARGYVSVATEEFDETVGLTLVRGRRFNEADTARSEPVVIISDRVAALLWAGGNPVGRWLRWDDQTAGRPSFLRFADGVLLEPRRRVIGVVTSVVTNSRHRTAGRDVYVPLAQASVVGDLAVIVRGSLPGSVLAGRLRERIRQSHPTLTLFAVGPLSEQFGNSALGLKWMAALMGSLGSIAAALAMVGLFGVIAHTATIRRREFGIMRALGASDLGLYKQAAAEGLRVLLLGIGPGLVMAFLAARVVRFNFVSFRWFDWQSYAVVPAAVLTVGMIACVLPVYLVLRQTPLSVLRDS
jgi:predicted permease